MRVFNRFWSPAEGWCGHARDRETFNLNWKAARIQSLGWFAWNVDKDHQLLNSDEALELLNGNSGAKEKRKSKMSPWADVSDPILPILLPFRLFQASWPMEKPRVSPCLVISSPSRGYWSLPTHFPADRPTEPGGGNCAAVENLIVRWEEGVGEAETHPTAASPLQVSSSVRRSLWKEQS